MHIRTFLKPLSFLPALILMYMIYSFSAQEGDLSSSVSYKASCVLVKAADSLFDMGLDDYQISYYATKINGVTRKLAHMTEYFLLAIAVSFPLYVYGLHGILLMLLAGGLCIAFACGDEYHQSFVAGRSPSMKDVAIDSFGVFVGIIIVRIIGWTGRMTIFRPIKKNSGQKLSKKEQKRMEKQMQAMGGQPMGSPFGQSIYPGGYQSGPGQEPGGPYPNGPYPNQGYPNSPYPNQNYPGQGYSGGPYADRQGADSKADFKNGDFSGNPYPEADGAFPGGPYPNQGYPNGPYPNQDYPGQGYPGGPYPGQNYPGGPYPSGYMPGGPYPYPPQYPPYPEPQDNHSSDELSEDMPLSHLLNPKK